MKSFIDLQRTVGSQPAHIGVLLNRIDVGKGREQLHADQVPELLRSLAERTKVESVRASNAIEGVEVSPDRAAKIIERPDIRVRNRNEKEFAGYRDAIEYVMRLDEPGLPDVPLALHFHRQLFRHADGRGGYLKRDENEIAGRDEHGRRYAIFRTVPSAETPFFVTELFERYRTAVAAQAAHPLLLLSALILDFLAIHPVLDGNGRVARLLTAYELIRLDYGVARYVSIEQRIYESRNSYYEALRQSQERWHDAEHRIWPWAEYLLNVLSDGYDSFEARVAGATSAAGKTKQDRARDQILNAGPNRFRFRDLKRALPGISEHTLRLVLRQLKSEGLVRSEGRGAGAEWVRTGAAEESGAPPTSAPAR
ncbi:MAG: Fic family protein [Solirubrobacterales bacterium]